MTEFSAAHRRPPAEDIDAITDANEHLRVIAELVQRHVAEERRGMFETKIDDVVRRSTDPNLHLAVIGEFSSGKSTFINGMLRTPLLKASCVATTASVTSIRKGLALTVAATLIDGGTITATADDCGALRRALFVIEPEAAKKGSLKELLDLLTSDSVVADHVHDIAITIPSEHLDEDVVILDTPGVNAGVEEAKNHAEVTQRVVNEIADCALVLIPSHAPMAATLIAFLQQHARSFLHRCVFVITAVDRLDDDERADARELVRDTLREHLGLESPFIVESAAKAMLPAGDFTESARQRAQSEFLALETAIRAALHRERTLIIAERLIRLLQDLVAEMKRALGESAAALADEERVLRENSVAAIEQVLDTLHARSALEIEKRSRALPLETATQRNSLAAAAKEWVYNVIEKAGPDVRQYTQRVHPQIATGVQHYGAQYAAIVNDHLDGLRARCEALSEEFGGQFEKAYRELPSLGVPISVLPITIAPVPRPGVFRTALAHAAEQGKSDAKRGAIGGIFGGGIAGLALGWLGTIPGAIIGILIGANLTDGCAAFFTALLGLIFGAIVGGVVGVLLAGFLGFKSGETATQTIFGPNLEERKRNLRTRLASDIDAFFDEMQRAFDAHIDGAVRGVTDSFANAVERHKWAYSTAVERLRRDHDEKQRAVAERRITVDADAADLEQRAARLETLRNRLARLRVPA